MTWAEIVALYRLALDRPPHNLQPRYNVCPTDPIDVVTERDKTRLGVDALGSGALVVVQATQGAAGDDVQRPRGDGG